MRVRVIVLDGLLNIEELAKNCLIAQSCDAQIVIAKIEKLKEEQVDFVYNIEKDLIGDCDKNAILNSLKSDNLNYYVLSLDDEIIGFFECLILPPEVELYDIAIVPSRQGNGYSKLMMDELVVLAKNSGSDTIFLEVNSMNNKAIKLYEKYGFKEYSRRKNYYGENDAILMKLNLNVD